MQNMGLRREKFSQWSGNRTLPLVFLAIVNRLTQGGRWNEEHTSSYHFIYNTNCAKPRLTVAVSLSRAFTLVTVTVLAPLQGRQSTVCHNAGLREPVGYFQRDLLWGWLRRRGQV